MTDPILQKLTRLAKANGVAHRTDKEPRYARIRERLRALAAGAAPGLRLPTIREMADVFQVTGPVVRRAVLDLAAEGVLRVKSRSGVFIAQPRTEDILHAADTMEPTGSEARTLTWYSEYWLSPQMAALRKATQEHEGKNSGISVAVSDTRNDFCDAAGHDVLDGSLISFFRQWRNIPLLNIGALVGVENTMWPYASGVPRSRCMLPIGLSMPCLIYNQDLLDAAGLAAPATENFAQQLSFFATIRETWKARKLAARPLCSYISPHVWLGSWSEELLRRIRNPDPDNASNPDQHRDLSPLAELLPLIHAQDFAAENILKAFQREEVACFLGWNYHVEALAASPARCAWGWRPLHAMDDRIVALPRLAAVRAETLYPVECARLIMRVREQLLQLPLGGCAPGGGESMATDQLLTPGNGNRGWILPYLTEEDAYLFFHVIGDEFENLLRGAPLDRVMESALRLGRAYLAAREPM